MIFQLESNGFSSRIKMHREIALFQAHPKEMGSSEVETLKVQLREAGFPGASGERVA